MPTRGDLKRNIRLKCGESSASLSETFLLDEIIDQAVSKVAQADAWYTYFDANIAGTSETPQTSFCMPSSDYGTLYKIKSARIWDGSSWKIFREGKAYSGGIVNAPWMDHHVPQWKESPTAGAPDWLVLARPNMALYPSPNYAKVGGIRLYGFGIPGKLWKRTATVVEDSDELPLPQWCQEAVEAWGVCIRSLQLAGKADIARYREYKLMFENELMPNVEYLAAQEYEMGAHE